MYNFLEPQNADAWADSHVYILYLICKEGSRPEKLSDISKIKQLVIEPGTQPRASSFTL